LNVIAKPIIAEQIPKYKIDSVEFEELSFTWALRHQLFKAYITMRKNIIK